jgi:hypothetical protein
LLGSALINARLGLDRNWFAFVWITIFVFGVVGWRLPQEINRRRRHLQRAWVLWAVFGVLLMIHCAVLGGIILVWRPGMGFPEWTILTVGEFACLGAVLEFTYRIATRSSQSKRE